ncbi:MAG: hypothetical protein LBB26_01905 [Puniceicoccales bacterium]|jgi:hypothetical protein|nr:hypothetical protein [Puniceicoccales bacterium]
MGALVGRVLVALWVGVGTLSSPVFAAMEPDVQIGAHFEPAEIFVRQSSQLVIDVHGPFQQAIEPQICLPDANVQRMQAVYEAQPNGRFNNRFIYRVTPWGEGKFTLNSSFVVVAGQLLPIPAATLVVREDVATVEETIAKHPRIATLGVEVPEKTLFLGQTVPAEITLSLQNGVRFRMNEPSPEKILGPFRVGSGVDAPIGSYVELGGDDVGGENGSRGKRWRTLITPTRLGLRELVFACGISVVLPEEATLQNYSRFFDQGNKWVPLSVTSLKCPISVVPLPDEKRPKNFSGAIGQFKLLPARIQSSTARKVGKPVEVAFVVAGEGNLQSVGIPELSLDSQWRLYRSRKIVEPTDRLGFSGKITFVYTLIPQRSDALLFPAFAFSYFDPHAREYMTLTYEIENPLTFNSKAKASKSPNGAKRTLGTILGEKLPLRTPRESTAGSFSSILGSYTFWVLQGFILWFYVWGVLRLWKHHQRERYGFFHLHKVRSPEIKALLFKARRALANDDQTLFYSSLRQAILATLAYMMRHNKVRLSVYGVLEILRSSKDRQWVEYFEKIRRFIIAAEDIHSPHVPWLSRHQCEKNWEDAVRLVEALQEVAL